MSKKIIGYTAGVYDMFHVGHLNLLKSARELCDFLIVGVNSDQLTHSYKGKYPVIPFSDRLSIVESIRYVDKAVRADDVVKVGSDGVIDVYERFKPDLIIIGDDHEKDERWQQVDSYLQDRGAKVVFIPYTQRVSSTKLKGRHDEKIEG